MNGSSHRQKVRKEMENAGENKLTLGNMATPLTVADAVIRENPEREWLEDVVYFINAYIERTYKSKYAVREDKE